MTHSSLTPRSVVLDTDTYNEVDDQFALAHLLFSPGQVDLEAVYAAPFVNQRAASASEGMEKSFDEIHRVLEQAGRAPRDGVWRGSRAFLPAARTPVDSPAAHDLVERVMNRPTGANPLHVCAIAAITNIASALLIEPRIAERIVVVWLGGHAPYWPHTREFNLQQDLFAVRVVLESAAPLVLVPCQPVASHLITTVAELEARLAPFSRIGGYLTDIVRSYQGDPPGWSKVIWDLAASAYLINPEWMTMEQMPAPVLQNDLTWSRPSDTRLITVVRQLKRDGILGDFFSKARGQP